MRCSPWVTLVTLDMMVIPRSFSSSFRSITRSDVMDTLQSRRTRSTSVVLLPAATTRTHNVSGGGATGEGGEGPEKQHGVAAPNVHSASDGGLAGGRRAARQ